MNLRLVTLLLFIVFGIYLFTLHPTVSPYRDSGDLITASSTLGLAHPPGYPLYVLVGKLFSTLVPFGNAGYRINVMSAFFGAGALIFLAICLSCVIGQSSWILAALLLLMFSPAYWRLSQVSEMYSLNAFLLGLILVFICKLYLDLKEKRVNKSAFYLIAFLFGIASANHETIIFVIPGLLWVLWKYKGIKLQDYAVGLFFLILGLSVYLFIPVRFMTGPVSSWGEPNSMSGFLRILTRSDYGGMKLHPEESNFSWSAAIIVKHLVLYTKSLAGQFTWIGVLLGVAGIYIKRKDDFFRFLLISLLISGPGFVILSNLPPLEETTLPILEPHFVLPNVLFMFFIAASFFTLSTKTAGKILISIILVISFSSGITECNYRDHYFAYDYGRNLFSTVKKDGLIYNPDDSTAFIMTYLQKVEKKRQDIKLIAYYRTHWGYTLIKQRYPELLPEREITSGMELERVIIDHNRLKYPVFSELPGKFPSGYLSYPYGFLYKVSQNNEYEPDNDPFVFYVTRGKYNKSTEYDFFTDHVISYYASSHNNLGLGYANKKLYDTAIKEYKSALAIDHGLIASYNNLGTLEYLRGNYNGSLSWFNKALTNNANNSMVLFNVGLTYKAMGDMTRAQDCFLKDWQNNGSLNAGNELGLLYLNQGNYQNSIELFNALIKKDPNYTYAYYNLGLAFQRAGNNKESKICYQYYLSRISDKKEKEEVQNIINGL
jgi:tetratricopeptide (TPR) repeat protein